MPRYCQRCILPDTRPGVRLDPDGICNGCRNAERKARIDWDARARAFDRLVANTRARKGSYDCIIPVSGGKDSHWQVLTCLEHGLHPLCVTYAYPGRTAHGEANLRNLVGLGVDHLDLRVNPEVERRFIAKAFRRTGISGLASHMGVYTFPIKLAVQMDIPLVIYGENSAFEYGTEDESLVGEQVDRRWLEAFGVTAGTTMEDWVDEDLRRRDLEIYALPPDEVLAAKGVRALFLGWYFPWDPLRSFEIARAHGFEARPVGARVGHLDYVNIDDDLIAVHHHAKWPKFGITRTWDTLSVEIRMGRMDRATAIQALRERGDETPHDDIRLFCDYVGMDTTEYFEVLERFRNREIWTRTDGRWEIEGFLVPDFPWAEDPVLV